jgi:heme/copper-type cytochrome/quinol oxidase subunit 3
MILFIASEVMFFAGLFAAYFNVRLTSPQWPPLVNEQEAEAFNLHTPEHLVVAGTLTAIRLHWSRCSWASGRSGGATAGRSCAPLP